MDDDFATCEHPIRMAGMCAVCGKTLEDEGSSSALDGLHDISGVQVTTAEAARLDSESTRHLLSQRKLALIVDLDQTIIHATVDPTVGEWMKDEANPNYSALADVGKFLLGVDGKAILDHNGLASQEGSEAADAAVAQDGCWYYVKPRPGLPNFLRQLSEKYEMHVYTMGTRTYAESVCRLVDPDGTIFGARIISRDENGSLVQKSLKKLFPMDTSMVVIIDDRADVWQWSPNLVRVSPFDFFVGMGDINATFLPKLPSGPLPTPEAEEAKKKAQEQQQKQDKDTGDDTSNSDAVQAEDDAAKTVAEESQKTAVNEQLGERPLAKLQEAKEAAETGKQGDDGELRAQPAAVLNESDRQLDTLQNVLNDLHARWYETYDARGGASDEKPAITEIIAQLKTAVLDGCTIVFSSIAPMNQDPGTTELWRLASEFGAVCKRALDATVTHVVAAKAGTEKVLAGHRRNLHVVWFTWLQESCAHWTRQSEATYAVPVPRTVKRNEGAGTGTSPDDARQNGLGDGTTVGDGQSATEGDEADEDDGSDGDEDEDDEDDDDDEDQGFGEMDWDEANDEVDAVLDGLSDEDDDDNEGDDDHDDESASASGVGEGEEYDSDRSSSSRPSGVGRKIKRPRSRQSDGESAATPPQHAQGTGDVNGAGDTMLSPLSKRRRMAELRSGQSKLKQVVGAASSSTPDSRDASSAAPTSGTAELAQGVALASLKSEPREEAAAANDGGIEAATAAALVSSQASTSRSSRSNSTGGDADFLQSLEAELELQLGADDSGEAAATTAAATAT